VAFSPDDGMLAAGFWGEIDQGIQLLDVATKRVLLTAPHGVKTVYSLALFQRDGKTYLAASGETGFL
jgi:hypothetical protein